MDWTEWGFWGLFLAAFLSGTVIPFSSEAVLVAMLSYGWDPLTSLMVATAGNWMGGMTSFWFGHLGNWQWIEKYFRVSHERVLAMEKNVARYGSYFAVLGWVPILGNVILLALGFFRANPWYSSVWMLIGKVGRYAIIIWLMK